MGAGGALHANTELAVMSSESHAANGAVLLGSWKAFRVTGAFVGRGVEVVLRCIYVQLD